jgi:alkylation response protein AidB-like acyl-CoA dehydrogenase
LVAAVLALVLLIILVRLPGKPPAPTASFEVRRADLPISVVEGGTLAASTPWTNRCRAVLTGVNGDVTVDTTGGGIGTSREHDVSLYYLRAKAADTAYGSSDFHNELVAERIGLVK